MKDFVIASSLHMALAKQQYQEYCHSFSSIFYAFMISYQTMQYFLDLAKNVHFGGN